MEMDLIDKVMKDRRRQGEKKVNWKKIWKQ